MLPVTEGTVAGKRQSVIQREAADRLETHDYNVLIVDDSELNRQILAEILKDKYNIIEAENGLKAVTILQKSVYEISLVLLDMMMPEADGFEVLKYMNQYHWIEAVPVIMISSETDPFFIKRAYELGATEFISRPFDAAIIKRRVANTIVVYEKQHRLAGAVAEQIYQKEKTSNVMISILSHIVEFRNGESRLHVLHINAMTEMLLRRLVQKTDRYSEAYVAL